MKVWLEDYISLGNTEVAPIPFSQRSRKVFPEAGTHHQHLERDIQVALCQAVFCRLRALILRSTKVHVDSRIRLRKNSIQIGLNSTGWRPTPAWNYFMSWTPAPRSSLERFPSRSLRIDGPPVVGDPAEFGPHNIGFTSGRMPGSKKPAPTTISTRFRETMIGIHLRCSPG